MRSKVTSAAFSIRPVAALVAVKFSADSVRVDLERKESGCLSVWSFGRKLKVVWRCYVHDSESMRERLSSGLQLGADRLELLRVR